MKYLLLLLLIFAPAVAAQEPKTPDDVPVEISQCQHTKTKDFYSNMRITPPMAITMVDARTFNVVIYTEEGIEHKTFTMDSRTKRPDSIFKIDYKRKKFIAIYCLLHSHAYIVEEVTERVK